jgi:HEAT repeat protein
VASGIVGTGHEDAIQTLICLMEDSDDKVRDWATFGLGTQCVEDSAEIREALRKRLNDTFEDARYEAIWGLARRRDEKALRLLLDHLDTDPRSGDEMTAPEILGMDYETPAENLSAGLRALL